MAVLHENLGGANAVAGDKWSPTNTRDTIGAMGYVPIGTVLPWLKSYTNTPTLLSDSFVECNGQTLSDADSPYNGQTIPDLNGSSGTPCFLRGNTSSGNTGGSETHNHQWLGTQTLTGGAAVHLDNSAPATGQENTSFTSGGVEEELTDPVREQEYYTSKESGLPTYYGVVFIMRVK